MREEMKKGIEFLDKECPSWRTKVKVDELIMFHRGNCILAQVFGDYSAAVSKYTDTEVQWEIDHAFAPEAYLNKESWDALTEEWKKILK